LADSISVPLLVSMAFTAASMSSMSSTWIWPIMTGSVVLASMPLPSLINRAMLLAAATTLGSSPAMGTR